jgi:hypothetical protein
MRVAPDSYGAKHTNGSRLPGESRDQNCFTGPDMGAGFAPAGKDQAPSSVALLPLADTMHDAMSREAAAEIGAMDRQRRCVASLQRELINAKPYRGRSRSRHASRETLQIRRHASPAVWNDAQ